MNPFTITLDLVLLGLAFICFWLPFKNGSKKTGITTGIVLSLLIILTLFSDNMFLLMFIWLVVIAFQLIFIGYWTAIHFGKKKLALIIAITLILSLVLLVLSPWIKDWTFSKNDVREILAKHNIELKDDFKIKDNESGGFLDYCHTFTLEISESDFIRISNQIKSYSSFEGYISDLSKQLPYANRETFDTVCYETEDFIDLEYFRREELRDGTYHFHVQLDKKNQNLIYIGCDE